MAEDFSSPAGSKPGAAKGGQAAAPGYARGICAICCTRFEPEAEPGVPGVFGAFINVVYCPECQPAAEVTEQEALEATFKLVEAKLARLPGVPLTEQEAAEQRMTLIAGAIICKMMADNKKDE